MTSELPIRCWSARAHSMCRASVSPLGSEEQYNHPRDLIKAAADFPDIDFLVYHLGFKTVTSVEDTFARTGQIPWTATSVE